MVNKKSIIIYCCLLGLLLIYLIKANDIMLLFDKDDKVRVKKFAEIQSNSDVYSNVDSAENVGGIFEKVYFQGWAFCGTEQNNSDKKISLIFKNPEAPYCYVVDTNPQSRPDVYGVFRDTKGIYNDMAGIECRFSTVKIKEGLYDFYVYVKENEYNYGLYDTGQKYRKENNGLVLVGE